MLAISGDSSSFQDQLKNVQQIKNAAAAFAAILADGSVITWGNARDGGDSNAVQAQLRNLYHNQTSADACAASVADESVVITGSAA